MRRLPDRVEELVFAAYLLPVVVGGAALCVRLQPPGWLGVGAVLLAASGWALVVARYLPPFRGKPPPWR
jgi:hypothetical protein